MFRTKEAAFPPDPLYPADLKALGLFVNNKGQVRVIEYPEKGIQYYYTNVERHNEMRKEAFQICQRKEVAQRLAALGLEKLYLPQMSYIKPNGPHIPILAPQAEILRARKRVVVIINDDSQDLGILTYRQLQRDMGLNGGSVINFGKEMIVRRTNKAKEDFDIFRDRAGVEDKPKDTPGLIMLNNGQLLFSPKTQEVLTTRSWATLPRKSICHEPIKIDEALNRVKGHEDSRKHIENVWKHVIQNPNFVAPDADLYVVGIETGGDEIIKLLDQNFDVYAPRIKALAVINCHSQLAEIKSAAAKDFFRYRTRQWIKSDISFSPEACVAVPEWEEITPDYEDMTELECYLSPVEPICATFGSGTDEEIPTGECIFAAPAVQNAILNWFYWVADSPSTYKNPDFQAKAPKPPVPAKTVVNDPAVIATQAQLSSARSQLDVMKESLEATPTDNAELVPGRRGLAERIRIQEKAIKKLEERLLAVGGLGAGEAKDVRARMEAEAKEKLKERFPGPKIPIAGQMVSADLAKRAGLLDTVKTRLKDLQVGKGKKDRKDSKDESKDDSMDLYEDPPKRRS
ncbi:hypothetical protein EJ04DRAFT_558227 [Polyplosphaeria fusca]|uniref:Arb2 domain-containing protein n=1 Tax=Polyplosphaeria fusca TaxID=682080 RepID=A0A9P4RDH0_9PLEO|nr:hypothetical protein EJ04DRAFT_558227 [Polyplosphaeria fusca]